MMPRKSKKDQPKVEVVQAVVNPNAKTTPVVDGQLPEYLQSRQTEVGRVVSDKMEKTVVVSVERRVQHPIYKKVMRRSVKFMAHDEMGAHSGDTVRIMEARPMSRHKHWQVIEILHRAEQI
jgi:small subunit ribosomal protein S17